MARSKAPKGLEVDGTAKLAAKSKPSDKHEKPELNIEEATVASPRQTRHRGGDYFDFEDEDAEVEEPSSTVADSNSKKSKKKAKTETATPAKEANKDEEPGAKPRRGRLAKGDPDEATEEKAAKPKAEKKSKAGAEDSSKSDKPDGSKKSKNVEPKSTRAAKGDAGAAAKPAAPEPKGKAKSTKATSKKDKPSGDSYAIDPELAMDEGPFDSLIEHEDGKAPEETSKPPKQPKAKKTGKSKKVDDEPETSKAKNAEATDGKTAGKAADKPKEKAKAGTEKAQNKAKEIASTATDSAATVTDSVNNATKAGADKVKKVAKTAKDTAPSLESPAEVADAVRKEAKGAADKAKNAAKKAKDKTLPTEKAADVADTVKKETKAAADKAKKAVQPKDDAKGAKKPATSVEQAKPESSKSKKRKASADDAETVKANLLDPLSEHAEASAKKKQKKDKGKSKSLGAAVGDLISNAAESANAAGASLGALATSIIGGAGETVESTGDATKKSAKSVAKKAKGKGKAIAEDVAESSGKAAVSEGEDEDQDDWEPDDQTAALLAGFESDGEEAPNTDPGFVQGQKVPDLPAPKHLKEKLKAVKANADEGPGVVYVGRIPHGFYEHEMRQYFSQFGDISRLRLSRNRKTGESRHFAFIEFKSAGVAKIVANTMDNYLMFGHILKCKTVPKEQLHESVWKGANKRFKKVPWNKKEGRKHEVAVGRDQWAARNEKEEKRRESTKQKAKDLGYEFEAPALKSVDEVPVKETPKEIENGETAETFEEEKSLVTAGGEGDDSVVISEEVKTKKTKKSKGELVKTTTVAKKTKRGLDAGEEAAGAVAKKAKKTKGAAS